MLCSVAVDLKISEVVDAPNWIITAFLPQSIFTATEAQPATDETTGASGDQQKSRRFGFPLKRGG
jgi:hypothetical protein